MQLKYVSTISTMGIWFFPHGRKYQGSYNVICQLWGYGFFPMVENVKEAIMSFVNYEDIVLCYTISDLCRYGIT